MMLNTDFYKDIVENLPEGMVICNADQAILDVNNNFEKLSGFSKEYLRGKNIFDFIINTKDSCYKCLQEANISHDCNSKPYDFSELKDKEGKTVCVRINSSKLNDDIYIYLITPLAQEAFLNQVHIDFVSTVSHELRTPLTSIKGFADTLLGLGDKLNVDQQKRFLNIIKSQVDRLTRLVENLLTVSKLESRKDRLVYKAIELPKFFENIIYSIQPKAQGHYIEVKVTPGLPPVWADSDKFEQVITNLVDNAIKYSNEGTKVLIEAKFASNDTNFLEISVTDQGIGIPEEHISKIFTKFARIDNPLTRQIEGTGLGLYITKSLVENMGGKISVKSSKEGSIFSLTLPVATVEKPTQRKF